MSPHVIRYFSLRFSFINLSAVFCNELLQTKHVDISFIIHDAFKAYEKVLADQYDAYFISFEVLRNPMYMTRFPV